MDILKSPAGLAGLVAAGVGLLLIVMLWRTRSDAPGDRPNSLARIFLVLLRVTIGWHFLVEGLDKLHTPNWSSEGYLREASGPLAPTFRKIAGDRLLDQLATDGKSISPALEDEWKRYVDAFAAYYQFDDNARTKAAAALEKAKSAAVEVEKPKEPEKKKDIDLKKVIDDKTAADPKATDPKADPKADEKKVDDEKKDAAEKKPAPRPTGWLIAKKTVEIPGPVPPPIPLERTVAERIQIYNEQLMPEVEKIEATLPEVGKAGWTDYKIAKANAAKVRGDLKKDLDAATASLTAELNKLISADQKWREPPPYPAPRPLDTSKQLDVSDAVVKYGLVVVGIGLIAGCFTRLAALAGAVLLLSFFAAMPPLPYLPESPKAEGHYLYINKNIIEMFALLALACLPTGRWAGVDGILQFLNPFRRRETEKT